MSEISKEEFAEALNLVDDRTGGYWPAIIAALRLAAASASGGGDGWRPIETAPTDGTPVWTYTAEREGLPAFQSTCAYHPDAGWCTDELRYVTHWRPMRDVWLPPPTVSSRHSEEGGR